MSNGELIYYRMKAAPFLVARDGELIYYRTVAPYRIDLLDSGHRCVASMELGEFATDADAEQAGQEVLNRARHGYYRDLFLPEPDKAASAVQGNIVERIGSEHRSVCAVLHTTSIPLP